MRRGMNPARACYTCVYAEKKCVQRLQGAELTAPSTRHMQIWRFPFSRGPTGELF